MNFKILMNVKRATFPSEKKNHKFLFFLTSQLFSIYKNVSQHRLHYYEEEKEEKKYTKKKEKMVPTTFETELIKKVINVKNIKWYK